MASPDVEAIRSELDHKVSKEDYAHDMGDIKVILMRIEGKLDNWRWTLIIVLGDRHTYHWLSLVATAGAALASRERACGASRRYAPTGLDETVKP